MRTCSFSNVTFIIFGSVWAESCARTVVARQHARTTSIILGITTLSFSKSPRTLDRWIAPGSHDASGPKRQRRLDPPPETYAALFGCAFCLAQRARCAAAIFLRAARLIRRAGLDALARFIFPCAQRCFSSRDSFLRAAALMPPRLRGFRAVPGGRPTLGPPGELTASMAEIAWSIRSRSARSSARILLVSMIAPRTSILTAHLGD